ncbi:MAG: MltA domain-containing protein, partial [Planctomycetes bacterium]|nr:MltA domain-containing protein [Planctomycetota bacterium]
SAQFFPSSGISHEQVRVSLEAFRAMLAEGGTADELAAETLKRFDFYISVGCDDLGTVLFTGYYTPIFKASRTRNGVYQHPLHRLPPNHVKDPITGETKGLRRDDGTVDANYPARAQLLRGGTLDGLELVWLADPVEAYVVQVQGSALLDLDDGTRLEVGYAGTNGAPYKSLGQEMVRRGMLKREELTLTSIMRYFRDNPGEFDSLAAANPRYVFFQETSGGPFGSLNEQVTAGRSIATDKAIFPRGSLVLADVPTLGGYRRLLLDQDTGGAIRAPGRCDLYWGTGRGAEMRAGKTYHEGRLYYLVLKDLPAAESRVQK